VLVLVILLDRGQRKRSGKNQKDSDDEHDWGRRMPHPTSSLNLPIATLLLDVAALFHGPLGLILITLQRFFNGSFSRYQARNVLTDHRA
jgi:hypothetical protein